MNIIIPRGAEANHIVLDFTSEKRQLTRDSRQFTLDTLYLPKSLFVDDENASAKEIAKSFLKNYKTVIKNYIKESYSIENLVAKNLFNRERIECVKRFLKGEDINKTQKFLKKRYYNLIDNMKENPVLNFYVLKENECINVPFAGGDETAFYQIMLTQSPIKGYKDIHIDAGPVLVHLLQKETDNLNNYMFSYDLNKREYFKKDFFCDYTHTL